MVARKSNHRESGQITVCDELVELALPLRESTRGIVLAIGFPLLWAGGVIDLPCVAVGIGHVELQKVLVRMTDQSLLVRRIVDRQRLPVRSHVLRPGKAQVEA